MLNGYTKKCGRVRAGIKQLLLIPAPDFIDGTFDTTDPDAVSAVTFAQNSHFISYQFQEDECQYEENFKTENGIHAVEQKITFKLPGMTPDTRKAVQEIVDASYCGLIGAIVRPDGNLLVGFDEEFDKQRPLKLDTTTGTTGKALTDSAGEEVVLTRTSTVKAPYYIGEVKALTGEAAAGGN